MKKVFLFSGMMLLIAFTYAQSPKYVTAMKAKIAVLDTTVSPATFVDLAASFERIGDAEKTEWLPYYYASYAQVSAGYMLMGSRTDDLPKLLDPFADRAEVLASKAESISKDNAEILLLKKMIYTLRMAANPMARYMTYMPLATEALNAAKKINPEIPRIYYLEGSDLFNTPEQFGGSKTEAKKKFELALQKFDTYKLPGELYPTWGRAATNYFMSQMK